VTARLKVFLSHSSLDKELARTLARDLLSVNIDVWFDQWEIGVGEPFGPRIEQGLEQAHFVLVLLTPASVSEAAKWVDMEWRYKEQHEAQTKRVAVVPVRAESCEIPDFLAQRSYADISGGSYQLGFRQLLTILRHYADEAGIEFPEGALKWKDSAQTMLPIVTPIALEVSRDLIPFFEPDGDGPSRALNELAAKMRDTLRSDFGFPFPGVRVRGNDGDMPPRSAMIMIDEVPELMFEVGPDDVFVDETVERLAALGIQGQPHDNPTAGRARIAAVDRAPAERAGLATWDAPEYLFLTLEAVLRRMPGSFIDIDLTHYLVDSLEGAARDRAAELVPEVVSWVELTDVLRRLVDEELSIRDLGRILEALSQREPGMSDTVAMTEQARHALRGQITAKFAQGCGPLQVIQMDPAIDLLIGSAIQRTAVGPYLALDPQLTQEFLASIRTEVTTLGAGVAEVPILVTAVEVRPFIRKLVSLEFPSLHVLSPQDVEPGTPIQAVARIRFGCPSHDATPIRQGEPS
jgi:type III secretory pathway component EscV